MFRIFQPLLRRTAKIGGLFAPFQEERASAAAEQDKVKRQQDKERYIKDSIQTDRRSFTDNYLKGKGLTASNATERDLQMAVRAFDRSQRAEGGIIYNDGGRMAYLKKKKYRQGGRFFRFNS